MLSLFAGVLGYRAESYLANAAKTMAEQDYIIEEKPEGVKLPKILNVPFPEHMRGAIRQVITEPGTDSFGENLDGIKYRVWVALPDQGSYYAVEYNIGDYLSVFLPALFVTMIFELLFFAGSIGKGAKAMKRALQPIADLTQSAKNINTTQTAQPIAQLRDLTGTIDTINATDLDTRISISSDQNELKDLAGAINGMLDRINEAYRSQIRFVSDASHELRTPIAVIQGYANLLDRWGKNDEEALQESIEAIKSEADNMKDLVEQLLFLARGDNDSMQLSMEEINLSELVAEIMRETVMIDPNHEFKSKTDSNVYTIGDIQLIKQAIRIFIDNSVKYTPYDGAISVTTSRDGDYAKVVVQDTGIGIPPQDIPHVFDRFFRADDSRARKTGGTGLGLSIAKWIIDRHRGTVEILSRKDIGTRIIISLPVIAPPSAWSKLQTGK
ncbi:signal transduction histidine kinase [Desulfoscipio gibsoniae DSM 7213]|uniref:histidine kinase n=2 Tax=Desulfoscipio gibsoniae TaxID=102134 RepID=R4KC43_9FIRM|nr:signal transduction histidine kinase [Desulfoscipio gibsoniae DSM 7213]